MKDRLIAMNLTVTCKDGSTHSDVTLTLRDGKRVYELPSGQKLCVEKIDAGVFLISPMEATMVTCYCPVDEP